MLVSGVVLKVTPREFKGSQGDMIKMGYLTVSDETAGSVQCEVSMRDGVVLPERNQVIEGVISAVKSTKLGAASLVIGQFKVLGKMQLVSAPAAGPESTPRGR